jgi:alkylation response protein AidB-like acyl-CoA dehydrogenase
MATDVNKKGGGFLIAETDPETVFTPEDFSEEQRMFAKTAEDFIQNEVVPNIERTEAKDHELMVSLLKKAGELGLLMIDVPEKYDGLGLDKVTSMLVTEIISWGGAFASSFGGHVGIGTLPIVYFGTDEQKQRYLPRLATGEILSCYALTEAGSGSDALAAKSRADLSEDGTHYTLNGEKTFITNGGFADLFIVFAKINGEDFSCFIVEKEYEGVSVGPEEKKMGIRGSSTVQLILDNVKVPVENLLGEQGKGHRIAFNILNVGRFKLGGGSVGAAKQAFGDSVKYANERHQFGRPISSFGLIKNKIADMATGIYVTESMSYRTAGLLDEILSPIDKDGADFALQTMKGIEEYVTECSIIKVLGSEMLDFVVDEAVQIHGGYGYVEEYAVERYYRDSRVLRIYEGTNEINRMLITGMLVRKAMKGQLPLLDAAKKLQAELLEMPTFDDSEPEELLGEEAKLIQNVKKVALLAAGVAVQKYMDKLSDQQGVLAGISDIIGDAYGMESARLRAVKMAASRGEAGADAAVKLTRLFVYETLGKIDLAAREVLAACSDGDELRTMLAALRRLTRYVPIDTLGLRQEVADYFIEKEKYEV